MEKSFVEIITDKIYLYLVGKTFHQLSLSFLIFDNQLGLNFDLMINNIFLFFVWKQMDQSRLSLNRDWSLGFPMFAFDHC